MLLQLWSSMIFFPRNEGSRLVQVRALEGNFPYYGALETIPPEASTAFKSRQSALVDESLIIQYDLTVGDSVKIGNLFFEIAGRLLKIPGETAAMSTIGPRVYIPMAYLDATGLIQQGSRAQYSALFKFDDETDVEALAQSMRAETEEKAS